MSDEERQVNEVIDNGRLLASELTAFLKEKHPTLTLPQAEVGFGYALVAMWTSKHGGIEADVFDEKFMFDKLLKILIPHMSRVVRKNRGRR